MSRRSSERGVGKCCLYKLNSAVERLFWGFSLQFCAMVDRLNRGFALSLCSCTRTRSLPSFSSPVFQFFRFFTGTLPLHVKSKKRRMPPKKAAAQEKKVLLGRPSNNLKIGIVGPFNLISDTFIILRLLRVLVQVFPM